MQLQAILCLGNKLKPAALLVSWRLSEKRETGPSRRNPGSFFLAHLPRLVVGVLPFLDPRKKRARGGHCGAAGARGVVVTPRLANPTVCQTPMADQTDSQVLWGPPVLPGSLPLLLLASRVTPEPQPRLLAPPPNSPPQGRVVFQDPGVRAPSLALLLSLNIKIARVSIQIHALDKRLQTTKTSSFGGAKTHASSQKLLPRIPGAATQNSPRFASRPHPTPKRRRPNPKEKPSRPPLTPLSLGDGSPRHLPSPPTPPRGHHVPLPPPLLRSVRLPPLDTMDPAYEELERRSRYLSALVRRTRLGDPPEPEPEAEAAEAKADVEPGLKAAPRVGEEGKGGKEEAKTKERTAVEGKAAKEMAAAEGKAAKERKVAVCVRAADMPLPLQRRAVRIAVEAVGAMPRLESKRLALALKKYAPET
ncbi:hypothetical protein HU200_027527 [Digitaria exilis]|uniref:Uncharacterized protein n=1 Tax=Digitaria exilis TaxID=1010633 RepID=A0A835BX98_9POAL|nr:hypothetical protein HU200_027527 [Digitaria exilis]